MRAIDTNVLVRYLRNDDPAQSPIARRLIDDEADASDPLLVPNEALVEIFWLLAKRQKFPRARIADILWALLDHAHLTFSDRVALSAAVDAYAQGPAGFVDYLIAATAQAGGAEYTLTFDREAAGSASFKLLSSGG
ncbi:MAG: Pil-like protein [Proteobacteria bacterium]|nr:Pil-like protein [Pseudomonadota bacterium]